MAFKRLTSIMQLDFQINRIMTYGEKACNENEVIESSKNIKDLKTWFDVWFQLGKKAETEQRYLHAGYYYRLAEFFLKEADPYKEIAYELSINNFTKIISQDKSVEMLYVPYETSEMKVHIYKAINEKSKIVVFGGYDSFIEEFYLAIKEICEFGYTIYLFEGPGQGKSLKNGLKFQSKWEKPVSAILDYFNLSDVTAIGISWGGYLVLRAAAFEKRIKKAICYDVLYDGFDCMTNPFPLYAKCFIKALFIFRQKYLINMIINALMKKRLIIDWAVCHGEYITGTETPYDFYMNLKRHTLKRIESKITCDVLLLAGEKDHYIPLKHYYILNKKLKNTNSLQGRLFTEEEGGEQHCQVGNHKIAIEYIKNWIEKNV